MTVSNQNPIADSLLTPADSVTFDLTPTGTLVFFQVSVIGSSTEVAILSSTFQAGFEGTQTIDGGVRTVSFRRTAGWDASPFTVKVDWVDDGGTQSESWSYELANEQLYPDLMQPRNPEAQGTLIVTDNGVKVRTDVGWIDLVGFTVTDLGNGKVRITASGGGGGGSQGPWASITYESGGTGAAPSTGTFRASTDDPSLVTTLRLDDNGTDGSTIRALLLLLERGSTIILKDNVTGESFAGIVDSATDTGTDVTIALTGIRVSDASLFVAGREYTVSAVVSSTFDLNTQRAGQISALTQVSVLADDDELLVEDQSAGYAKRRISGTRLADYFGGKNTVHKDVAAEFSPLTGKSNPVGSDLLLLEDSADSFNKKKLLLSNLLATLSTQSGFGIWQYSGDADTTPTAGKFSFDTSGIAIASNLYIHENNATGMDLALILGNLKSGDKIYIGHSSLTTVGSLHTITGTPTVTANVWNVPLDGSGVSSSPNWVLDDFAYFVVLSAAGAGDVAGPASSTNESVALFDGLTGKLLKSDGNIKYSTLNDQLQLLGVPGSLLIQEGALAPSVSASFGGIWIKNDVPAALMYTDDLGADAYVLRTDTGPTINGNIMFATNTEGLVDSDPDLSWVAGTNNTLVLNNGAWVRINETGTSPTNIAAYGFVWVRNDAPNSLIFTDDDGTDKAVTFRISGTTVPGVGTGNGYPLGTIYTDTTNDIGYILVDNTTGANVWSGGGTGNVTGGSVSAAGEIPSYTTTGGKTIGRSDARIGSSTPTAGTRTLSGGGALLVANIVNTAGTATAEATGAGDVVLGALSQTAAGTATLSSGSSGGTIVSGLAQAGGTVRAFFANGSAVFGRADTGGTVEANVGAASFVQGAAVGAGAVIRNNLAAGGLARGNCGAGSTIINNAAGGFTSGQALNGGNLTTGSSSPGAVAIGNADTNNVSATGAGAFAVGSAVSGAIVANAANAAQFGVGTNAVAGSLQVGNTTNGIRLIAGGTTSTVNGSIWCDGTDVFVRTGGVTKNMSAI